ncbi:helix-turn-helix domain-containing protein [Stenotrophomonas terrae]|uniref:helix-turn-helix domain-containing protein n=1 Tax=Stenotrophomonas terrae TaxID=405446 RepID=UPI00070978C3|nr:helix-turn-helix domain-containing protein [Stenotrophomonas terrae]
MGDDAPISGICRSVRNRIKAFREARGLSLDKLASLTNTTNQQISNLEAGRRRLTVDWLQSLGQALGCHPWALIADDVPRPLESREIRLLDRFRGLTAAQQKAVLQLLIAIPSEPVETTRNESLQLE